MSKRMYKKYDEHSNEWRFDEWLISHFVINKKLTMEDAEQIFKAMEDPITYAYKAGLRRAIEIIKYHPEGEGNYCDTGDDMDWACRSRCVGLAVDRLAAAIRKEK